MHRTRVCATVGHDESAFACFGGPGDRSKGSRRFVGEFVHDCNRSVLLHTGLVGALRSFETSDFAGGGLVVAGHKIAAWAEHQQWV